MTAAAFSSDDRAEVAPHFAISALAASASAAFVPGRLISLSSAASCDPPQNPFCARVVRQAGSNEEHKQPVRGKQPVKAQS